MAWVKLDDAILDNPKILAAGPLGFALHVAAICYCARNLTDGFLPTAKAASLLDLSGVHCDRANPCGRPAYGMPTSMAGDVVDVADLIESLVELDLWHVVPGGFEVHDFLEYNPSRAKVEADRQQAKEQRSEAGKASAAKRRERAGQRAANESSTDGQRAPNGAATKTERKSNPDPDPDPDPKKRERARASAGALTPTPRREADAAALCDVLASRCELFGDADLTAVAARLEVTLEGEPKADRLDRRQVARELVADVEAYSAKFTGATPEQRVAQLSRKLAWILGDVASGRRRDALARHEPSDGFPDLDAHAARLGAGA